MFTMRSLIALLLFPVARAMMCEDAWKSLNDSVFETRIVVNDQVMGARAVVAGDLDGDGDADLVSASSTDNTIAWYENLGDATFSAKRKITYDAKGARIVTLGDVDGDGILDIIYASYYDNTIAWFQNDGAGGFGERRLISDAVDEGQGVVAADLDGDGDLDIVTASSGDNTVAWFENLGGGLGYFCEIKRVVDDAAIGVRTVVAADFDGDGTVDLASASKDDNTIAVYLNDASSTTARTRFITKQIVNATAMGAYSLVAADIDQDGDMDLVTASNGDDTVSFYRNDGSANFEWIGVFSGADFVLSVTTADFDLDGDIDIASASFFDGGIRWYENVNLNGDGTKWTTHPLRVIEGTQGHYVSVADMDGDGDTDLLVATHAENTVALYLARSVCDNSTVSADCCATGTEWNSTAGACVNCAFGYYGNGAGSDATCVECPDACVVPGLTSMPLACSAVTGCATFAASLASCACAVNEYLDTTTDKCRTCARGQTKAALEPRNASYNFESGTLWRGFSEELCEVMPNVTTVVIETSSQTEGNGVIGIVLFCCIGGFLGLVLCYKIAVFVRRALRLAKEDEIRRRKRCKDAIDSQTTLSSPAYLVTLKDFARAGRIPCHEEYRDNAKLLVIDNYLELVAFVRETPVIFLSHQWASWDDPDPDQIQYNQMINACRAVAVKDGFSDDEVYVFVDFTSIPQKNMRQRLNAISMLGVYSASFKYFIVIAPSTVHKDTRRVINMQSYQKRGWCRLEQWGHMCAQGMENMFSYQNNELTSLESSGVDWILDSIMVLDGDFTEASDREVMVDIILGLYFMVLTKDKSDGDYNHGSDRLYKLIEEHHRSVFPEQFFHDYPEILTTYVKQHTYIRLGKSKSRKLSIVSPDKAINVPDLEGRPGLLFPPQKGLSGPRAFADNSGVEEL